jgi:hypothetical protein
MWAARCSVHNPGAPLIHAPRSPPVIQVYEGLKFKLTLSFPAEYPYKAPTVIFATPCFHPNVDMEGRICLDILKEKWSAVHNVRTILLSIQSLLGGACGARLACGATCTRRCVRVGVCADAMHCTMHTRMRAVTPQSPTTRAR